MKRPRTPPWLFNVHDAVGKKWHGRVCVKGWEVDFDRSHIWAPTKFTMLRLACKEHDQQIADVVAARLTA